MTHRNINTISANTKRIFFKQIFQVNSEVVVPSSVSNVSKDLSVNMPPLHHIQRNPLLIQSRTCWPVLISCCLKSAHLFSLLCERCLYVLLLVCMSVLCPGFFSFCGSDVVLQCCFCLFFTSRLSPLLKEYVDYRVVISPHNNLKSCVHLVYTCYHRLLAVVFFIARCCHHLSISRIALNQRQECACASSHSCAIQTKWGPTL